MIKYFNRRMWWSIKRWNVQCFSICDFQEDHRISHLPTLKSASSIHVRSGLIPWKTSPPKAFLSFLKTTYEGGKTESVDISSLTLDSVPSTISGSCSSRSAWKLMERFELLRLFQFISISFSLRLVLHFVLLCFDAPSLDGLKLILETHLNYCPQTLTKYQRNSIRPMNLKTNPRAYL